MNEEDLIEKMNNDPIILITDYINFSNGKEKEDNIFLLCDKMMTEDEKVEVDKFIDENFSILENSIDQRETTQEKSTQEKSTQENLHRKNLHRKNLHRKKL